MFGRKSIFSLCSVALLAVLVSPPALAVPDGTPGYEFIVPNEVPNGDLFHGSIQTPGAHLVVIMASLEEGVLPTQWGMIGLQFPLLVQVLAFTPSTGILTWSCPICTLDLIRSTFHVQFLGVDLTDPSQGGVSNVASFTITEGFCHNEFVTFTPGGWGTECNGQNPGCIRDAYFSTVFPTGVILGDQDGPDADSDYALLFTSSMAVQDFLPAGSTPDLLDSDQTDPLVSSAGVYAGHLLAAKLNVAYDAAGVLPNHGSMPLGDLVYVDCVDEDLLGFTVNEVIVISDKVISGAMSPPTGVTVEDLKTALDVLNNNFPKDADDKGCLGHP